MTSGTSAVDPSIYGAVAGVAAITTALQSVIALLPLREAINIARRKRSVPIGHAPYNDARHDARRDFFILFILNFLAASIHAAVLAAWWKVGVAEVNPQQWEYWLPWAAVTVASGVLVLTAVSAITWLAILGWRK